MVHFNVFPFLKNEQNTKKKTSETTHQNTQARRISQFDSLEKPKDYVMPLELRDTGNFSIAFYTLVVFLNNVQVKHFFSMRAGQLVLNFKVYSVEQQCDTTISVCTRKAKFIQYDFL